MDGDAFERSGGDFAADAKDETKPEGETADFVFGEGKGSDFDASERGEAEFSERADDFGEARGAEGTPRTESADGADGETSREARKKRVTRGHERADDGGEQTAPRGEKKALPDAPRKDAEKSAEPGAEETRGRFGIEKDADKVRLPDGGNAEESRFASSETRERFGFEKDAEAAPKRNAAHTGKPGGKNAKDTRLAPERSKETAPRPKTDSTTFHARKDGGATHSEKRVWKEESARPAKYDFKFEENKKDAKQSAKNGDEKDKGKKKAKKKGKAPSERIGELRADFRADGGTMGENVGVEAGNKMVNAGIKTAAGAVRILETPFKAKRDTPFKEKAGVKEKGAKAAGKAVKAAGKGTKAAGKTVKAAGKTVEYTGKAVKAAGKGVEYTGKGIKAAGKGVEFTGKGVAAGGAAIASAGAAIGPFGIPLQIVGGGIGIAGTGVEFGGKSVGLAGKGVEFGGKGIGKAGKSTEKAGKSVGRAGERVREKGRRVESAGKRIERNAIAATRASPVVEKKGTGRNILSAPVNKSKEAIKKKMYGNVREAFAGGNRDFSGDFGARASAFAAAPVVKIAAKIAKFAVKAVAGVALKLLIAALPVLIPAVLVLVILMPLMGGGSAAEAARYKAGPIAVNNAEKEYGKLEAELRLRVESVESDHPGYDEYRYNIGNIGHNPYELLAYLSVKYGDFGMTTVQSALLDIFNRQYALTFTPSAETTYNDPADADGDGDLEAHTRNILNVTLSVRMQSEIFYADMNEKERKQYDVYMHTKGGLQGVANPVDANWLYLVTSDFGYYVGGGDLRFNDGVTISPPAGTEAKAGVDGIVAETQTSSANGGPYVVLEVMTEEAAVVRIKYGGLQEISVSAGQEVKIGDALGKTGANGLYFEIKLGNTAMNPLFFADTGDAGKLLPVYGDAPPPPGDGTVAAFLAEAQSYLGTPYYFYTVTPSTPPTSFNCSSFVNYALNRSGFLNVPYSNATYLYLNYCVPITAEEAVPGDLVFFEGTYSGATLVSHVGIYLGGDQMVHSGNPNRYASINTAFWREHFYTFARLKTG